MSYLKAAQTIAPFVIKPIIEGAMKKGNELKLKAEHRHEDGKKTIEEVKVKHGKAEHKVTPAKTASPVKAVTTKVEMKK
tara:strand:- start:3 stop:239 length:237 start_codon:yes stop_codon:yes gene_type:complete